MIEHLAAFADLVERMAKVASRRSKRDEVVFKEVIDPTYVQLDGVVTEMNLMYSRVAAGITTLLNERRSGAVAAAETHVIGSNSDDRITRQNVVFRDEYLRIATGQQSRAENILSEFIETRRKSQPFRIKIDAAAQSLHNVYSIRNDEFAERLKDWANKVRSLVGRAHNVPLASWNRSLVRTRQIRRKRWNSTSGSIEALIRIRVPEIVRLKEYSHPKLTSPNQSYERRIESPLRRQAFAIQPRSDGMMPEDGAWELLDALAEVGRQISSDWEDLHYIYARLRLCAILKV